MINSFRTDFILDHLPREPQEIVENVVIWSVKNFRKMIFVSEWWSIGSGGTVEAA